MLHAFCFYYQLVLFNSLSLCRLINSIMSLFTLHSDIIFRLRQGNGAATSFAALLLCINNDSSQRTGSVSNVQLHISSLAILNAYDAGALLVTRALQKLHSSMWNSIFFLSDFKLFFNNFPKTFPFS